MSPLGVKARVGSLICNVKSGSPTLRIDSFFTKAMDDQNHLWPCNIYIILTLHGTGTWNETRISGF